MPKINNFNHAYKYSFNLLYNVIFIEIIYVDVKTKITRKIPQVPGLDQFIPFLPSQERNQAYTMKTSAEFVVFYTVRIFDFRN